MPPATRRERGVRSGGAQLRSGVTWRRRMPMRKHPSSAAQDRLGHDAAGPSFRCRRTGRRRSTSSHEQQAFDDEAAATASGPQHCAPAEPHAFRCSGSSLPPYIGTLSSVLKGFPRDTLRIARPVLVAVRIAAVDVWLVDHVVRIGRCELRADCRKLVRGFGLQSQVVQAGSRSPVRDGEVHARVVEHPLRIVGLLDRRRHSEEPRVETNAGGEVGHA